MYRLAYVMNFLIVASIGAVFVFLSDIKVEYGLPGWGIGLIASTGFLATIPITFVLSPFADRGYTGIMIVGSAVLALAGNLLFGFGDSLWDFVVSRGMLGAAVVMAGIASRKALIGTDVEGSGKKLGTLLSVSVAGFIFGPPLGAQLERFGFATVFIVLGIATVIAAVPVAIWAWTVPIATSNMKISSALKLLDRPNIQGACISFCVLFGSVGVFDSTVDIYLEDLGASNNQISVLLLIIGTPLVLVPAAAGAFVERTNAKKALIITLSVGVLSIAGYGVYPSLLTFGIAGLVHSVVESFAFPATEVVTVQETGAAKSASGQALLEAAGSAAAGVTAFSGPLVYDLVGPRVMFAGYGALVAGAVVFIRQRFGRSAPFEMAPAEPLVI